MTLTIGYLGNFGPPHSTENHVTDALERLGHHVRPMQENDPGAWASASGCARAHEIDMLLWTRTGWTPPVPHDRQWQTLEDVKAAGVPVIGFHLDRWWGLNREPQIESEPFFRADVLYTADGGHDELWRAAGIEHVWSPPGVLGSECERVGVPRRDFTSDLAFVGSVQHYHAEWPHRQELVKWALRTYRRRFGQWPRGRAVRGQDLSDLYASVKVVLGDSCLAGGATHYWSDRIPETLGRGGFLLHPYVEGLRDHFPATWVDSCTWEVGDWRALGLLVEHWLDPKHDEERRDIAEACRSWVQGRHTYEVRMAQIIEDVQRRGLLVPLRERTGVVTLTRADRGEPRVTGVFDLREGRYDGIAVEETWKENVYRLTPADVRDRVVVDVGANVGAFTVWAAKAGARQVHAYEPHPAIYAQLINNLVLNGLYATGQVVAYNEAVGAASGHGYAVLGHSGYEGGSYVTAFDEAVGPSEGVEVATSDLTTVLLRAGSSLIVKVDCEGCEYLIFEPVDGGHLRRMDKLVLEFHGPEMHNSAHVVGGGGPFGQLVAKLAEEGHVETLGRPSIGGTVWWRRYGS